MPVPPYSPFSSDKPSTQRLLFTAATAVFVFGGLFNLAVDQEEVAFSLPEPPTRPLVDPVQPTQPEQPSPDRSPPAQEDALDNALAHVMANISR